jgi:hypothetical protein
MRRKPDVGAIVLGRLTVARLPRLDSLMRRPITLLMLCATVACGASTHSRANAHASAPAPPAPIRTGHADVNLTGTWATGSANEPEAKQIELHPQCNYNPALWIIQQDGDTLRAWKIPESHDQGIATRETVSNVPVTGWVSGVDVTTGKSGERYVLHYDSTSGHLRGTLNDTAFWAVRLNVVRPEGCIPVP